MHKSFVLALAASCGAAMAQTPAYNPMPDGSHDMYLGLGVQSAPEWEGARERRVQALPLLQVQWSNGIFISGMTAGMHLSSKPAIEYGPMLALLPRRSESGSIDWASGAASPSLTPPKSATIPVGGSRLVGMDPISTRVEGGVFLNYYLTERLRLNNVLAYGAGNERNGLRYTVDLQTLTADLSPRHKFSALVGLTFVNGAHNAAYFGVTRREALTSRNRSYVPGGGLRDVHASLRWNMALSPAWMLASQLQVRNLRGDAAESPLTERKTNITINTGLAYRF